jgi:hypothetical protein
VRLPLIRDVRDERLPTLPRDPMLPRMFIVSEAEAAAIRTAYEQGGELAAAVELRRLFPGLANNENTRICARTIAGWKPLPEQGGVGEPRPATVRAAACQITRLRPPRAARKPGSSTP